MSTRAARRSGRTCRSEPTACGARIREERKKRRLSQTDLAARMQVCGVMLERDSISRIELGTRFIADYELMVIADILSISVGDLIPDTFLRRSPE